MKSTNSEYISYQHFCFISEIRDLMLEHSKDTPCSVELNDSPAVIYWLKGDITLQTNEWGDDIWVSELPIETLAKILDALNNKFLSKNIEDDAVTQIHIPFNLDRYYVITNYASCNSFDFYSDSIEDIVMNLMLLDPTEWCGAQDLNNSPMIYDLNQMIRISRDRCNIFRSPDVIVLDVENMNRVDMDFANGVSFEELFEMYKNHNKDYFSTITQERKNVLLKDLADKGVKIKDII